MSVFAHCIDIGAPKEPDGGRDAPQGRARPFLLGLVLQMIGLPNGD